MNLIIFGATGGTGRELVRQALADGHEVTVYVRNPDKVDVAEERLTVVAGNLNEPDKIRAAIVGADAVLSTLGPTENKPGKPITAGMTHIVAAMEAAGVKRLIVSTGAGVRQPEDRPGIMDRIMGLTLRLLAGNVLADSRSMVAVVQASDLDWTVVRAPRLTDDPAQGTFKAGYVGQGPGMTLTRADFARFMLDQVSSPEWVRQAPMVSN